MLENILKVVIEDEIYGFNSEEVKFILTIPAITHVPLSDKSVLGVSVINGQVISVIDLGVVLRDKKTNINSEKAKLIVFRNEAFVVDEVLDIVEVDKENLEIVDEDFIYGFYKDKDYLVQLLNTKNILKNLKIDTFEPVVIDIVEENINNNKNINNDYIRALFFKVEDEKFAINIESLRELIFVPEITFVANNDVLGVITLRDEVITLLDMNKFLGFKSKKPDEKSRVLIAFYENKAIGFLVDEVEEVKNVYLNKLEEADALSNEMIESIYKDENEVVSIISIDEIRKLVREHSIENKKEEKEEVVEESMREVTVFKIDNEEYAFDIEEVQEIIRYDTITPIPDAPQYVEGVLNLRGAVIPIISLPKRLGYECNITDKTKIIVCSIDNENIGFIVDDVNEILFVEDKYISKATNDESVFDEIINLDDGKRVILKIKVKNLISNDLLDKIKMIRENNG